MAPRTKPTVDKGKSPAKSKKVSLSTLKEDLSALMSATGDPLDELPQAKKQSTSNWKMLGSAMHERKAYKALRKALNAQTNINDAMSVLHDLLLEPRYYKKVPCKWGSGTGEPVEWKTEVCADSKALEVVWIPHQQSTLALPDCLIEDFESKFEWYKDERRAVVYSTESSADNEVRRGLLIQYDVVQTGGSHNDSPSYAGALRIQPVYADYALLSGKKSSKFYSKFLPKKEAK